MKRSEMQAPIVLQLIQSSSRPDVIHELRKSRNDGSVYCTCEAWIYSKGPRADKTCGHVRTFAQQLATGTLPFEVAEVFRTIA